MAMLWSINRILGGLFTWAPCVSNTEKCIALTSKFGYDYFVLLVDWGITTTLISTAFIRYELSKNSGRATGAEAIAWAVLNAGLFAKGVPFVGAVAAIRCFMSYRKNKLQFIQL